MIELIKLVYRNRVVRMIAFCLLILFFFVMFELSGAWEVPALLD